MRLVVLKMPENVNPDYAANIARDAMEKVEAINRRIQLGESDELVTLALPSGWSYEVVDDVDCLSPGQTVVKSVVAAAGARGVDGGEQAREY